MKKIKFTYRILKNPYEKSYSVFKQNEEHFISTRIFTSPVKKECVEYIKNLNKKVKK